MLAFDDIGGSEAANFDIAPPLQAPYGDFATNFFSAYRLARVAVHGSNNPNVSVNRRWWIDGSVDTLLGGDLGTTDYQLDEASEHDALWSSGDFRPMGNGADVFLRSKLVAGSEIYAVEAFWWGGF